MIIKPSQNILLFSVPPEHEDTPYSDLADKPEISEYQDFPNDMSATSSAQEITPEEIHPENNTESNPENTENNPEEESNSSSAQAKNPRIHINMEYLSYTFLVLAIIVALILFFWNSNNPQHIRYVDFLRLVEQGSPEKNPDASILAVTQTDKKRTTIKYWDLSDVVIGQAAITGKIRWKLVSEETINDETQQKSSSSRPVGTLKAKDKDSVHKKDHDNSLTAEKTGSHIPQETSSVSEKEKLNKQPKKTTFITHRLGVEDDQGKLIYLLKEKGFTDSDAEAAPGMFKSLLPSLIFLGLLGLIFYFIIRQMGGSMTAFGRNQGQLYEQDEVQVSFSDVAGVDEAVEELREVVEFLRNPQRFQNLGARIPKGVLLVGPPGTGKTLLAKAVAGEAEVPFLSISGSDFVEMFVGVGAARVRDMFRRAQEHAPCIIFIDELDALGKARSSSPSNGSGHDEREQTLNALLVEMDGFTENSGVMVLAATNRPETLDAALLRPGRFDRQILVDRPDIQGREKILRVHAKKIKLEDSVNLHQLAAITSGFVGADLANLINEAALLAARRGLECVSMAELNEGVERVVAGLEKKTRVMNEVTKRRVAWHESAHALAAHLTPEATPVHKVSIIPRGAAALGYTMQRPGEDRYLVTKEELEAEILVLLAGSVGEELVFGNTSTGAQNDLERATEVARGMVMDYGMSRLGRITFRKASQAISGEEDFFAFRNYSEVTARELDEEIRLILNELSDKVRILLETHRFYLDILAEKLLEVEVVSAEDLEKIMSSENQE